MTLPRTAAEVLSGHVMLEVRCIDRVMLTFRQPRLQYGQGIHNFFCQHRGNRFVSSALMLPMTAQFTAGIRHYIDTRRLDLARFAPDVAPFRNEPQSKLSSSVILKLCAHTGSLARFSLEVSICFSARIRLRSVTTAIGRSTRSARCSDA